MISSYIDCLLFKGVPDGKVWCKCSVTIDVKQNI